MHINSLIHYDSLDLMLDCSHTGFTVYSKAVGSGKAGKALALPDFPPSVQFLY